EISNLLVELAGIDIYEALKFMIGKDRKVAIRCAFGDFAVEDGVMTARALAFDTSDTIIIGKGTVDLGEEQLDLELRPRPKDRSILALRSPLVVDGSFRDPGFRPDMARLGLLGAIALTLASIAPPAALLATLELGPGEDSDCGGEYARYGSGRVVVLQLVELVLLLLDHRLDHVADRHQAQHAAVRGNRQEPGSAGCDQLHARGRDVIEPDGDDVRGHDVAHRGFLRRAPVEHDLPRVVAFGHHAGQPPSGFQHH